jgi:oligoribonuclease NrnB/cAMP/cGMP phosphodiesterase (DHH superfamily)
MLAKQSYLDTVLTERQNQYQIALGERDKLQNLITQTGGKAKISYADTYESALQKATKYTEKKVQKDAIKQLYLQTFGSTGKGKSTKEMEKKLKKAMKSSNDYDSQVKSIALQSSKIQLQKLQAELQKVQQENSGGGIDIASLFGNSNNTQSSPQSNTYVVDG